MVRFIALAAATFASAALVSSSASAQEAPAAHRAAMLARQDHVLRERTGRLEPDAPVARMDKANAVRRRTWLEIPADRQAERKMAFYS